jgi:transposase
MRWLDRQIPEVEEHIEGALEAWPREDRLIMSSFPGMSKQRQAVLLASVGDFADFRSDRQLRKLLGWYPELRESGSSLAYHRLGRGGNRLARREIWLWCLQLLLPGAPTPFRLYYERLRQRGLSGKVAMGHVAGKLISVLFYCVRHQQPYDANLHARALGLDSVIEEVVVDPIP